MSHTVAHDSDPHAHRRGYLAGTDYAPPYQSRFSRANAPDAAVLRHANCGYLSTPAVPPTLLALKQHAQSLCCLISMLEPHAHDKAVVEAVPKQPVWPPKPAKPAGLFGRARTPTPDTTDEAILHAAAHPPPGDDMVTYNPFDWLADLNTPYTNEDPDHHRPLHDLANEVRSHHEVLGTTFHCPLETYQARGRAPYQQANDGDRVVVANGEGDANDDADEDDAILVRPHASHHNLLMHANMCLERLDHEFSHIGGLLSLLPATLHPESEEVVGTTLDADFKDQEDAAARNSLIGQLLVFTQQLVGRMHELEIAYGSALDALSSEAHVPLQLVDAGSAAQPAPPPPPPTLASIANFASQDRWILANAGDDVWSFLHGMLDQQGRVEDTTAATWAKQGVISRRSTVGDRLLYVDVNTRFYRVTASSVAGSAANSAPSRGPLFVCPAWEKHPGLQPKAADRETRPTVVMVPFTTSSTATAAAAAAASGTNPPPSVTRVSSLEHRYDGKLRAAGKLAHSHERMAQQVLQLRKTNERLLAQMTKRDEQIDDLEDRLAKTSEEVGQLRLAAGGADGGGDGNGAGRKRTWMNR